VEETIGTVGLEFATVVGTVVGTVGAEFVEGTVVGTVVGIVVDCEVVVVGIFVVADCDVVVGGKVVVVVEGGHRIGNCWFRFAIASNVKACWFTQGFLEKSTPVKEFKLPSKLAPTEVRRFLPKSM
jgi:hypothetical protein